MQDDETTMIPVDQINADFTEDTEPRDEQLLTLLKHAYTHAVQCCFVPLDFKQITPFSGYQPKVSATLRQFFDDAYKDFKTPSLMVYERGDEYVMSDDYDAYYLYKEKQAALVPCIVLDPSERTLNLPDASKPYYLDAPGV